MAHATGEHGRIEHPGVDRIKVEDGKVVENRIFSVFPHSKRLTGEVDPKWTPN